MIEALVVTQIDGGRMIEDLQLPLVPLVPLVPLEVPLLFPLTAALPLAADSGSHEGHILQCSR